MRRGFRLMFGWILTGKLYTAFRVMQGDEVHLFIIFCLWGTAFYLCLVQGFCLVLCGKRNCQSYTMPVASDKFWTCKSWGFKTWALLLVILNSNFEWSSPTALKVYSRGRRTEKRPTQQRSSYVFRNRIRSWQHNIKMSSMQVLTDFIENLLLLKVLVQIRPE